MLLEQKLIILYQLWCEAMYNVVLFLYGSKENTFWNSILFGISNEITSNQVRTPFFVIQGLSKNHAF